MWYYRSIVKNKGVEIKMIVSMLEKCKERQKEIEEKFYKMLNYSSDIPMLEKLSDDMINMELMIIRIEKQQYDKSIEEEYVV